METCPKAEQSLPQKSERRGLLVHRALPSAGEAPSHGHTRTYTLTQLHTQTLPEGAAQPPAQEACGLSCVQLVVTEWLGGEGPLKAIQGDPPMQ